MWDLETYIFKPCLNCDFILNSDLWMHYFLSREVLAADKMEPDLYCKGSQIVTPSICGSLVWNLLYVTLLVPRILRWLLDFLKNVCTLALLYLQYHSETDLVCFVCKLVKHMFWNILTSFSIYPELTLQPTVDSPFLWKHNSNLS